MSASSHTVRSPTVGLEQGIPPAKRARSESPTHDRLESHPSRVRRASDTDSWSLGSLRSKDQDPYEENAVRIAYWLTSENLGALESVADCGGRNDTAGTPSCSQETSSNMVKTLDDQKKLLDFNVLVLQNCPIPQALQNHIEENILKPRLGAASPHGKEVVKYTMEALPDNEDTLILEVLPTLMEGLQGESKSGMKFIARGLKPNLSPDFLPQPPRPAIAARYKALSQPQPDVCYGYVSRHRANVAAIESAFSQDEEDRLGLAPLTDRQHLPFLTMQWKSPTSSENIFNARLQGGRDGATIVNHISSLYKRSLNGREPTLVQASHLSMASNGELLQFFVHWREKNLDGTEVHHMEFLKNSEGQPCSYSMQRVPEMEEARNVIKNIAAYATGPRLESIKAALKAYDFPQASKGKRPASAANTSTGEDLVIPTEGVGEDVLRLSKRLKPSVPLGLSP